MNIVTPIPLGIPVVTTNVNTEAARRDNVQRETVPQTSGLENSAAETGVGSESDRVRAPGQPPAPLVYERPQAQPSQQLAQNAPGQEGSIDQDNGDDPSAGRENAESRQQEQQERAEQQEVQELRARDREVRAHEQAHAAVGGQYAGAPSYDFETGPDGQRYAVGGEVQIDISEESDPEETLRKMQQVRAAALAPAEPSSQDLRVAAEASQRATEARADIAEENREALQSNFDSAFAGEDAEPESIVQGPDLDDITDAGSIGNPRRSLNEDPVAEAIGLETGGADFRRQLANRGAEINERALRIAGFYQDVAQPSRQPGFSQIA